MPTASTILAYAKQRARSDYQQSIFRRTIVLCGLVLPGFAANFLVYFFSAKLLPPDQFGLFYVALTIGNILYSGSNILNAYLTRHLVNIGAAMGADIIAPTTLRLERHIGVLGAVASTLLFLALLVASNRVGVQSPIIILLIVLDTYTAYVSDLGRVLLQSLRRTITLGVYTTVWMFLRFALCMAGIIAFGTVWGALVGIVASTVVIFVLFHLWVLQTIPRRPAPAEISLPLLSLLLASAGYGLMVLVSNLDVLFGYFVLNQTDLGVYSGSSVFPKAALVVITPLLQMLIPAMTGSDPSQGRFIFIAVRIGGVILMLSGLGSLFVWLLSPELCGSKVGLKLCEPPLLSVLLLSVVPLSLLRTLVMIEFARQRERLLLWLIIPALAYSFYIWNSTPTMEQLAFGFSVFSFAALIFFVGVCLLAQITRRRFLLNGSIL